MDIEQFENVCIAIGECAASDDYQRVAVALWELVDHEPRADKLWSIMLEHLPAAFANVQDANSIRRV